MSHSFLYSRLSINFLPLRIRRGRGRRRRRLSLFFVFLALFAIDAVRQRPRRRAAGGRRGEAE